MRKIAILLTVATLCASTALAQQAPAPQTARQALIEMFFSKTSGTLMKHMPDATRAALEKSGGLTLLQQYSALANHLESQGKGVQTFETGSVLLATEDQPRDRRLRSRLRMTRCWAIRTTSKSHSSLTRTGRHSNLRLTRTSRSP
jgi:hypothetical protein